MKIAIATKQKKNFTGSVDCINNKSSVGTFKISGTFSGGAVIVSKIGRTPKNNSATAAAETEAVIVAIKVSAENFEKAAEKFVLLNEIVDSGKNISTEDYLEAVSKFPDNPILLMILSQGKLHFPNSIKVDEPVVGEKSDEVEVAEPVEEEEVEESIEGLEELEELEELEDDLEELEADTGDE